MTGFPEVDLITSPFGSDDPSRTKIPSSGDLNTINQKTGIPVGYCVPTATGGSKFTRHDMNGIGYLATLGGYLNQVGYPYVYDEQVAEAIGGYPKGAILKFYCERVDTLITRVQYNYRHYQVCEIVSLKDDNLDKPFLEQSLDLASNLNKDSWGIVDNFNNYNYFPEYDNATLIYEHTAESGEYVTITDLTLPQLGWVWVVRKFEKWPFGTTTSETSLMQLLSYNSHVIFYAGTGRKDVSHTNTTMTIPIYSGQEVGMLFPIGNNSTEKEPFKLTIAHDQNAVSAFGSMNVKVYSLGG